MMRHPSVPSPKTFHCCLTEEDGRRIGMIGFQGQVVPRYLFIDEETMDLTAADEPGRDAPMGSDPVRPDRLGRCGSTRNGADRAVHLHACDRLIHQTRRASAVAFPPWRIPWVGAYRRSIVAHVPEDAAA